MPISRDWGLRNMSKMMNIIIGLLLAGIIIYALLNVHLRKKNSTLTTNQNQTVTNQTAAKIAPEQNQIPRKKMEFKKTRSVGSSGKSSKGVHRGLDGNIIH